MSDLINLSCPSCLAKSQVTKELERFACASCGSEHVIKRSGGIVSLSPVVGAIKEVKHGFDKIAAELVIIRLKKDLIDLNNDLENLQKGGFGWEVYILFLIIGLLLTIAGSLLTIAGIIFPISSTMTPIFYISGIPLLIFGIIGIIKVRAAGESEKERILEIIRKIEIKEKELKDKQNLFNNQ
jgi:hypothetical protein